MLVVLAVATAGLFIAAPAAHAEQISSTVSGYGVRVRVYSQMCDNGFQHTRVNVRNSSGRAVGVTLSDPDARDITYRPTGYVPSGTAQAISITAAPNAPARTATVAVNPGGTLSIDIPFQDCCPQNPGYSSCTEVKPTVVPAPPGPPSSHYDPPITPTAQVIPKVTTAVESGTLPFTGSDVRFISAVAAVFVILGGAFMVIQFRNDSYKTLLLGEVLTRRGLFGPSGGSTEA
jgi:hypothetical protein